MRSRTRRALADGVGFGITAGMVLAMAHMAEAVATGFPALSPYRLYASAFVGRYALDELTIGAATFVGLAVHLTLAAIFGAAYMLLVSRRSLETRIGWLRQAGMGLLFGLGLWVVNVQLIARAFYPWFLDEPQVSLALLHAVAFGLPVALMSVVAERRDRMVPVTPAAPRAV